MQLLLDRMAELANAHPMSRPMRRTGRALLKELDAKIRAGEFPEQSVRDKLNEFSQALAWAASAPKVIPPHLTVIKSDDMPGEKTLNIA
jgi:hypothetical protein